MKKGELLRNWRDYYSPNVHCIVHVWLLSLCQTNPDYVCVCEHLSTLNSPFSFSLAACCLCESKHLCQGAPEKLFCFIIP